MTKRKIVKKKVVKKPVEKPKIVRRSKEKHEAITKKIISIYRDGGNTEDIEEYLKSIGREKQMRYDIYAANLEIKKFSKEERESLINTHVKRYEKLYNDNKDKDIDDFPKTLPGHIRKYMVIDSLVIALDALVAKERVMGLHTKTFRVQLNNFFKKKIVKNYNFNSHDLNDLIRLKQLLEKMRKNKPEETQQIEELADVKAEIEAIDVDYVEVNTQVSDKIKETVVVKKEVVERSGGEVLESLKEKIINKDLEKVNVKKKSLLDKINKMK